MSAILDQSFAQSLRQSMAGQWLRADLQGERFWSPNFKEIKIMQQKMTSLKALPIEARAYTSGEVRDVSDGRTYHR
jgi:hypothetical protein